MQTHTDSFSPGPTLTAPLGSKLWTVDFFSLSAENPWDSLELVQTQCPPLQKAGRGSGSQKGTGPRLLHGCDLNSEVYHKWGRPGGMTTQGAECEGEVREVRKARQGGEGGCWDRLYGFPR